MKSRQKQILRIGLPWAIGMFLIMTFILPTMRNEEISLNKVLIAFPLWLLGGWLFGYMMVRWGVSKK